MSETWRRITEFPDYEVSATGSVRTRRNKAMVIPEKGLIAGVFKLWRSGDPKKIKGTDLSKQYFPELQS